MPTRAATAEAAALAADGAGPSNPPTDPVTISEEPVPEPTMAEVMAVLNAVREESKTLKATIATLQANAVGNNTSYVSAVNNRLTDAAQSVMKNFAKMETYPDFGTVGDWFKELEFSMANHGQIIGQPFDEVRKAAILKSLLQKESLVVYDNLLIVEPDAANNYDSLKERLLAQFDTPGYTQEANYKKLFKLSTTSLSQMPTRPQLFAHLEAHRAICAKLAPLSEEIQYYSLLGTLPDSVQATIRLLGKIDVQKTYDTVRAYGDANDHRINAGAGGNSNGTNNRQTKGGSTSANPGTNKGPQNQPISPAKNSAITQEDRKLANRQYRSDATGFYPTSLHAKLDQVKGLREFLVLNNICTLCRKEGHSRPDCSLYTAKK